MAAAAPDTEAEALALYHRARDPSLCARPDDEVGALSEFLEFVGGHREALGPPKGRVATALDDAAVSLHRDGRPELALRAIDLGLALAPDSPKLLHHKALLLIAQDQGREELLPLLDRAIAADPHDKSMWATRADALQLLGRTREAADAYVRAQKLDATSTQYVDRALRLVPDHPVALRLRLELARAHGGDRAALGVTEGLLAGAPHDPELLVTRVDLLFALGELVAAYSAIPPARAAGAPEPALSVLDARILFALGQDREAIAATRTLVARSEPLDPSLLLELAIAVEERGQYPELALSVRERLQEAEPRNQANLDRMRVLAAQLNRPEAGLAACRAILAIYPDNLEAMRGVAELLLALGRPDEAFEAYRTLLRTHPHDVVEARRALEAAQAAGRLPLVEEFARVLLALDPKDAAAEEALAHALAAAGERAEAVRVLDGLVREHPGDVRYLVERKDLLAGLEEPEELRKVYDEIFRVDPTRTDIALERGNLYLTAAYAEPEGTAEREEAARAALGSYERASRAVEGTAPSLLGIARASRVLRDHERAAQAYRQFLARPGNERRTDILQELGHSLREVGRYTEADEAYGLAIQLGLETPELLWEEVEVLSEINQESRALRYLDLLLQHEPGNASYLRRKGQLLLSAGRRSEGLALLKQAIGSAAAEPRAYFETAEALRAQGAYADALDYYRQGLELAPTDRAGRLARAETLVLAGQYHEAVPLVDALLKEDPNDLPAWKTRADAFRALGRTSELVYSLTGVLLLDPDNTSARLEKSELHEAAGETQAAFETLSPLANPEAGTPAGPAVYLRLGELAGRLGRADDANRAFARAAELDPAHAVEIAFRRARTQLGAGRPDLALEILDKGLQSPGAERTTPILLLRAEILGALERAAEARTVYEEVLRREPQSASALAGIGRALLDEGKHGEAREFLRTVMPRIPPAAPLYLLLAEAESGLGNLPAAIDAVRTGVAALPQEAALWSRLGELAVATEAWSEAASALAHALSLAPTNASTHLRAGFVAERLGHPNEAFAFYDRATQVEPANKDAWTSRGISLLALGRPDDARGSFERALAIDPDLEPAKEGKKASLQRARQGEVERAGREALLLEARLNRPVTKNDLFVTLHVPFDLLEPVLVAIGRSPEIDIDRLRESDLQDLENASYHLIAAALERRPPGIERRGLTLADVAVLSSPGASLEQIQRLFGYVKAVLEADLRPENLKLSADVEELARKALVLPEGQRTLFQLVRTLRVGLFKARLIKVVESAGGAVHAPLPSLDLGQYSPEFRAPADGGAGAGGEAYFSPENVPAPNPAPADPVPAPATSTRSAAESPAAAYGPAAPGLRCVGCGGLAAIVHACGAPVCQHCIGQFRTCPKCAQPITMVSSRPMEGVVAHAAPPATPRHRSGGAVASMSLKSALRRPKKEPASAHAAVARAAAAMKPPAPVSTAIATARATARTPAAPPDAAPSHAKATPGAPSISTPPAVPAGDAPVAPPRPAGPRGRPDDEPRL